MVSEYDFGDIVFLKTDPDQRERIVVGWTERPGVILYDLACGTDYSTHYEFEITEKQDILKKVKGQN